MREQEEGKRYSPFIPDEPDLRYFMKISIGYPPVLALLGFLGFWVYLIFFASHLINYGAQGDPGQLPLALHSIAFFLLFGILYNLLFFPAVHVMVKHLKPGFAISDKLVLLLWVLSVFSFFYFFDQVLWLLD